MGVLELLSLNLGALLLILAGIALMGLEMFMPGFGLPGIAGLICAAVGVAFAADGSWSRGLLLALVVIAILCLMLALAFRSAHKGRLSKGALILNAQTTAEAGFNSTDEGEGLLGKEGITLSPLRPSGTISVEGERFDVVTESEFVATGVAVSIVEVEGRRIVVRPIKEAIHNTI